MLEVKLHIIFHDTKSIIGEKVTQIHHIIHTDKVTQIHHIIQIMCYLCYVRKITLSTKIFEG